MDFLSSPEIIRNIDNQSGIKYQELDHLFKLISGAWSSINDPKLPSLSFLIQNVKSTDPCDFEAIGFPGTLESAFFKLSETFTKLLKLFQTTGQNMLSQLNSSELSKKNTAVQEFEENLQELQNSITEFQNLQTSAMVLSNPLVKDCQEFRKMTEEKKAEFLTGAGSSDVDQRAYEEIFDTISSFRKSHNGNRIKILSNAQQLISNIVSRISSCGEFLKQNIEEVQKLLEWYKSICIELADGLSDLATQFQSIVPSLNFQSDFTSYITENGIVRYDAMDFGFVQYNTASPAFEGLDLPPLDEEKPIVPIGLARVIRTYKANGQNETSCKKGSSVFITEEMDQKWCYVMNTTTFKAGFVPTCCLERVSKKFAIVPKDISTATGFLQSGDFVAIVDQNDEEQTYQVVSAKNVQMSVLQQELMVIYS